MITVTTPCQDVKPNTFMIEGKYKKISELLHCSPFACWHLKRHVKGILMCTFLCILYTKWPFP